MALCHFPYLFVTHNFKNPHLNSPTHHYPLHKSLTFACSAVKSRKNGKGSKVSKSNEDLCKELREFVSAAGLFEDHMPSMKELSENGRKDLANIVRRRGYKVITELLQNSLKNDSDSEKPSVGDQNSSNACGDEASEVQERILVESDEPLSSPSDSSMAATYLVRTNGAIAADTSVQISESSESSVASFHLNATKFVQTGKIEIFEDANEVINEEMLSDAGHTFSKINSDFTDDIASMDSLEASLLEQQADWDLAISSQGLKGSDNDENLPSEMAGERINQTEIDSLKAMLHQKEMELLELKHQIEKKKQSLQIMQGKSNGEIGNAHRMEIEKDMELCIAEESLSGLKEVQIEYWGNGKTVEVAGSFNGWHNRIKMDLTSCKPVDSPYSRNLRLWLTILWLYPGIFEIKFIVDGTWSTDPNREITTSCNFTNNVLRVDR